MACILHGFRLEVSGLIGAKAILGHDLTLRESKLKGLYECGYMCVFGHDCKRENQANGAEAGVSAKAQIRPLKEVRTAVLGKTFTL